MRLNKIITALLIAGTTAAALAQPVSVTGRVQTVYVREARGLYYEKKLLTGAATKPVWAEVRTEAALPGEPQTELVRVPANLAVERGDIVSFRTGDETPLDLNLIPSVSRVTALVARHDTLAAITYGVVNPAPAQNLFVQAHSPWVPAQAANIRSSYR
jgi:hypothetical protein